MGFSDARMTTMNKRLKTRALLVASLILIISVLQACKKNLQDANVSLLQVSSPSFSNGGDIPRQFTCNGANISPSLSWTSAPEKTGSLAVIASDQDTPFTFIHWIVFNLPPGTTQIPEGIRNQQQLPEGSLLGITDFDTTGYGGPCPPAGVHRYNFTIYALDSALKLQSGADVKQLRKAMEGHLLAEGNVMGRYQR
jgi:hypothetical protein